MNATIAPEQITIRAHTVRPDVDREFLTIDVPGGWDEVQHMTKRVLVYDGRSFAFSGWNSDQNVAYFFRPLANIAPIATWA